MSRKDYVKFAAALKEVRPGIMSQQTEHRAWLACVHKMVDVLASDNGRFDRNRFLDACGA